MLFFKKKCFIVVMVKHFFKKGVQKVKRSEVKNTSSPLIIMK